MNGTMYFNPISKSFAKNLFLRNKWPLIFKNQPAIIQRNNAFRGIKRLDVVKSRKSKIFFPNIFKSFNIPKDSVAGIASADTIQNNIKQAFVLENLKRSTIVAIGTSIMLIPEVIAAAKSSIKNATEIMLPCGIWENMYGNVTNTNPAPEDGSSPKENIAGNIIIPAISANIVSEKIIVYVDFVIFLSSLI